MSRYQIQGAPMLQQQPGALGLLKQYAMGKGANMALDAVVPGAGIGREIATQVVMPSLGFNQGGMAGPLGGGQSKAGLEEARRLGALSQAEYLKAMQHAGYLNEGGGIHIKKGNEGKFTAKAKAAGMGVQEYARSVLKEGSHASPATKKQANFARNAAAWHKEDGGKIGPLAKTVHKTKDGESYEINYHNPLMAKPAGGDKKEG